MARIILLGPPGAGKGTQADILSEAYSVPHIATGDILRSAVSNKTELGHKAEQYMSAGELVPDFLMLDLIRERLSEADAQQGWILDGFPRTVPQAEFLDTLLDQISQPFDVVVNLAVPDEVIVARLLKRGRQDDVEEIIRHRLELYHAQTEQLIDFYRQRQCIVSVNGNQTMQTVYADLEHMIHP